mmetsp:Transcript_62181/g.173489  ORF Transcript_62181/g.173489 Transcript_62181/m.173489 type:complete len:444 (-) Transcript_62181:139-1470(-)
MLDPEAPLQPDFGRGVSAPPAASRTGLDTPRQPALQHRIVSAPVGKVHPEGGGRSLRQRTHQSPAYHLYSKLRRSASAVNSRTVRCNICLDNIPYGESARLRGCGRETHSACVACLTRYLQLRVEENRVDDLWCPCHGDDDCEAKADESELEELLDADVFEKYKRFSAQRDDTTLRECPECHKLVAPRRDDETGANGSKIVAEMTCDSCGCDFCYYHSNAHGPGKQACAEYERQQLKQEKRAAAAISALNCPGCGQLTEKTSGCNHMTCTCGVEWCWVCGKEIKSSVGWHYNPLKPMSCAQFNEKTAQADGLRLASMRAIMRVVSWPGACITLCFILAFIILVVAFQPVMLAALTASCCCLGCCCGKVDAEFASTAYAAVSLGAPAGVLFLPFCLFWIVWCIFVTPFWLLMKPCGSHMDDLKTMGNVPFMTFFALGDMAFGDH